MSYVVALPEMMFAAATNVASIGSLVATANQGMAEATTAIVAAAEDEVSAAIAALFSAHGKDYRALSAQVAAYQVRFEQALAGATEAYAAAEIAGAAPLAVFEQTVLGIQQIPTILTAQFNSLATQTGEAFLALVASDLPPLSWLAGNSPPPLLNLLLGQTVSYSSYEGMRVVQITPAQPTGEYVVAMHGGAFVFPASFFHWINYSVTSYMTGATFQVPIYPLAQEGGTAGVVVPKMAGLVSSLISQHGAENVSVVGDSAGGNLALAAVQHLVSQNLPVPSSVVLISPWLDVANQDAGYRWAGGLPVNNPMVSPLYGSLEDLPPTYIYSGAWDPLVDQAVALQQRALQVGAPISNFIAPFQIHDWVLLTPFGWPYWPQINRELGIAA